MSDGEAMRDEGDEAAERDEDVGAGSLIHTPQYADPVLCCGFGCANCRDLRNGVPMSPDDDGYWP